MHVEDLREAPALLHVNGERVFLVELLAEVHDQGQELLRLERAVAVLVQLVEVLQRQHEELLAADVLHQPLGQEGDDAPQPLLVFFDHRDEFLERGLLNLRQLDGGLPFLALQEADHDDELHQTGELVEGDDSVLVGVEHLDEAHARVLVDHGHLVLREAHDDRQHLDGREVALALPVERLELGLALRGELLAAEVVAQLLGQEREHHGELVVRALQRHDQGLDLVRSSLGARGPHVLPHARTLPGPRGAALGLGQLVGRKAGLRGQRGHLRLVLRLRHLLRPRHALLHEGVGVLRLRYEEGVEDVLEHPDEVVLLEVRGGLLGHGQLLRVEAAGLRRGADVHRRALQLGDLALGQVYLDAVAEVHVELRHRGLEAHQLYGGRGHQELDLQWQRVGGRPGEPEGLADL
mmetsp:Transcript_4006/g.10864  ORF Transcript_4006/g.10864 Transcript_4006/m.10864 type:complete len:408 (+) Transcript_4006:2288-3511(+)